MCTGLEIAAMVAGPLLGAVGQGMQAKEQNANIQRQADARNEKLKTTLAKNDQLAQQSRDIYNNRAQQAQGDQIEQDRQQKTDQRANMLEQAVETAPANTGEVSLSGSAPQVVKSELAKKMADTLAKGKEQAQAQAKLGGYGDSWMNQGFQDVEAGRGIGQAANFAAGNMAILPYQQDIAETRATKPISPFGSILSGLGSAVGSFGGGGGMSPKKSYTSPSFFQNTPGLW